MTMFVQLLSGPPSPQSDAVKNIEANPGSFPRDGVEG